jgi:GNAT superfamily N-acetyltransferase
VIRPADRAVAKPQDEDRFLNRYPHPFTDAAIGRHTLHVEGDAILGGVGCHPFACRLHGRELRLAGIGQVGTAPEAQGRGLMTGLLAHALAVADADLFWLYGDRQCRPRRAALRPRPERRACCAGRRPAAGRTGEACILLDGQLPALQFTIPEPYAL